MSTPTHSTKLLSKTPVGEMIVSAVPMLLICICSDSINWTISRWCNTRCTSTISDVQQNTWMYTFSHLAPIHIIMFTIYMAMMLVCYKLLLHIIAELMIHWHEQMCTMIVVHHCRISLCTTIGTCTEHCKNIGINNSCCTIVHITAYIMPC